MTFNIPGLNLPLPPIGLLGLLARPIIVWSVVAPPWRPSFTKTAWPAALTGWARPWFWLLIAPAIPILGHFVYTVTSEYLPKDLTKLAESVALRIKVEVCLPGYGSYTPFDANASLAGFLGFAIGVYLFLEYGLQRIAK